MTRHSIFHEPQKVGGERDAPAIFYHEPQKSAARKISVPKRLKSLKEKVGGYEEINRGFHGFPRFLGRAGA